MRVGRCIREVTIPHRLSADRLRGRTPLSLRDISPHCGESPFTQGGLFGLRRGGFYIRPGSFVAAQGSTGEHCSPLRENRMLGVAARFRGASRTPPPTHNMKSCYTAALVCVGADSISDRAVLWQRQVPRANTVRPYGKTACWALPQGCLLPIAALAPSVRERALPFIRNCKTRYVSLPHPLAREPPRRGGRLARPYSTPKHNTKNEVQRKCAAPPWYYFTLSRCPMQPLARYILRGADRRS